jgi:type II secretory pathway pseudopilin PulG
MIKIISPTRLQLRKQVQAFSLIELLVVISLTVILLALLFAPLIQAFSFTQTAQATAEAQDAARSTTEQMTRELGSAAGIRDTTNNYLDMPLLNSSGTPILAHAYNAYIDIIPPRVSQGTIVDPTVDTQNPTLTLPDMPSNGQEFAGEGVTLPLSAGSTVIRYFSGPRYPIDPKYTLGTTQYNDPQPYTNRYEGMKVAGTSSYASSYVVTQGLDNTYQLYRANFQPFIQYEPGIIYNGATTPANGTYVPNTNLFPTIDNGTVPYYDDPDFFRIVVAGQDLDLVPGQADAQSPGVLGDYNAATATAHNDRVYNWFKIAKEVIATRDIDLAGLTRAGNKVVYDAAGNPVDSYEANGTTPIVRMTVNFAPALISNDPMAAANTSNSSQGFGSSPPAVESALPYVPSQFDAQYGNWQGTPAVTIVKTNTSTSPTTTTTLQTGILSTAGSLTLESVNGAPTPGYPAVGDLVLNDSGGNAVYDITQSAPITGSGSNVTADALMLNQMTGTIDFAMPAIPPPLAIGTAPTPASAYWSYTSTSNGTINLETNFTPGAYPTSPAPASPLATVPNAQLVVNSERVVGPDQSAGIANPSNAETVQYTRVPSVGVLGPNQYEVNYATGVITVPSSGLAVQIAYSYQNNLTTGNPTSAGNADIIDTLSASYYTASMIRLNLGFRVYSSTTSASQYFSLDSQVGVSNAKAN